MRIKNSKKLKKMENLKYRNKQNRKKMKTR